jgi:hypothetical protein
LTFDLLLGSKGQFDLWPTLDKSNALLRVEY